MSTLISYFSFTCLILLSFILKYHYVWFFVLIEERNQLLWKYSVDHFHNFSQTLKCKNYIFFLIYIQFLLHTFSCRFPILLQITSSANTPCCSNQVFYHITQFYFHLTTTHLKQSYYFTCLFLNCIPYQILSFKNPNAQEQFWSMVIFNE